MAQTKKITVSQLRKMKQEGRKIVMQRLPASRFSDINTIIFLLLGGMRN